MIERKFLKEFMLRVSNITYLHTYKQKILNIIKKGEIKNEKD